MAIGDLDREKNFIHNRIELSPRILHGGKPEIEILPGNRRLLTAEIGPMSVTVLEVPSSSLVDSKTEQEAILEARKSYGKMWGPPGDEAVLQQVMGFDAFDFPKQTGHESFHYITSVALPDGTEKWLTMRMHSMPVEDLEDVPDRTQLPDDISFWLVRNEVGATTPLRHNLASYVRSKTYPDARIGILSRVGTFSFGTSENRQLERDRSAIGFALMQELAATRTEHAVFVGQLCDEMQDEIFALEDVNGRRVTLDFSRTEDILELDGSDVILDNTHPGVVFDKLNFPGYWLDNGKTQGVLRGLALEGRIDEATFYPAVKAVASAHRESGRVTKPGISLSSYTQPQSVDAYINYFALPPNAKYLTTIFTQDKKLTKSFTTHDLRIHLLENAGDGPFSTTILPKNWAISAKNLRLAATVKYSSIT